MYLLKTIAALWVGVWVAYSILALVVWCVGGVVLFVVVFSDIRGASEKTSRLIDVLYPSFMGMTILNMVNAVIGVFLI